MLFISTQSDVRLPTQGTHRLESVWLLPIHVIDDPHATSKSLLDLMLDKNKGISGPEDKRDFDCWAFTYTHFGVCILTSQSV